MFEARGAGSALGKQKHRLCGPFVKARFRTRTGDPLLTMRSKRQLVAAGGSPGGRHSGSDRAQTRSRLGRTRLGNLAAIEQGLHTVKSSGCSTGELHAAIVDSSGEGRRRGLGDAGVSCILAHAVAPAILIELQEQSEPMCWAFSLPWRRAVPPTRLLGTFAFVVFAVHAGWSFAAISS